MRPCFALPPLSLRSPLILPPLQAVLSTYSFDSTMTLTLLQGLVTVICLESLKRLKYIDYPSFDWGVAKKVAPLSFV
jgi:hypothetical protein